LCELFDCDFDFFDKKVFKFPISVSRKGQALEKGKRSKSHSSKNGTMSDQEENME
jgi:hypothetical protein